jgi:hypothetical protein
VRYLQSDIVGETGIKPEIVTHGAATVYEGVIGILETSETI